MSLYVNVLKNLRTPFIKLVLARQILTRVNTGRQSKLLPGRDSVIHTLISSFNKQEWLQASVRPVVTIPDPYEGECVEAYPVMPNKPTRKTRFDVFQDDFIFLQFTEFRSHMEVYRIHELYNALKAPLETENDVKHENITPFSYFNVDMFDNLKKNISELNKPLPKNDPEKFVFKSIVMENDQVMFYREQIKLCYHLQRFLDKKIAKYPEFTDFHTYLNDVLQNE